MAAPGEGRDQMVPFRVVPSGFNEPRMTRDEWRVDYPAAGDERLEPALLPATAAAWSRSVRKPTVANDPRGPRVTCSSRSGKPLASVRTSRRARQAAPYGSPRRASVLTSSWRETAGALEQAGFGGVMLPAWWTGRGAQARVQARAKVKGASPDRRG